MLSTAIEGPGALGTSGARRGTDGASCGGARFLAGLLLVSPVDFVGMVGEGGGLSVEETNKPTVDAGDPE